MRSYILSLSLFFIGFLSCKNEVPADIQAETLPLKVEESPVTQTEEITPVAAVIEEPAKKVEKKKTRKPVAKFDFPEKEYDFGMKEEGDIIKHDFPFTNTGKIPMIITSAESTCGCTIPEWPKEPIAPGESGVISATFDTKGKLGSQKKVITIRANTYPKKTTVALVGFIGTMAKKKEKVEKEVKQDSL